MVDVDVRLGLSGSDLAIRERTFKADLTRLAESNLTVEDSAEVKALVEAGYGAEIVASKRFRGQDFLTVRKERIVGLLTVLRDHAALDYKLVSDIFGVDLLGFETEPRFEVVYSLYSLKTYRRVVVKAQVSEDDLTIDTTSGVWLAAEWAEREIFDLFGITFNHHADMRRILMPDDWVGHPLRKDFPLGGEEVEFSHNVREQAK